MKIKHTPGPWVYGYGETHEIGDVLGVGLNLLPDWKPVCVISQASEANAEDEANAKLISAAPELLEIAESILADDMLQYLPAEYVARVRAAIAKATGGAA